jgi:hypothetical protein
VPLGPTKVEISGPTPFKPLEKLISPHPNPYVQTHINNRYIGNFMDKRQERDKRFQAPFRDGEESEGENKRGGGVGGWGVGVGE